MRRAAMCGAACGGGAACAHAVVCELSPALISCRCGVDQETLLEFYCQSSKLAAKDKAQVGFEAKNCKRVLIICEIVAFFSIKPPIYNPPNLSLHPQQPKTLYYSIHIPNAKTTENHQNVWKGTSFIFIYLEIFLVKVTESHRVFSVWCHPQKRVHNHYPKFFNLK